MKKRQHGELYKTLAETGEALADTFLQSEVAKAIPFVSLIAAGWKEYSSYSDRALAAKLHRFLDEPHLMDALESEEIRRKLADDEYAEEIGERLFLIIDKFTDLSKPVLLARIFAAYAKGDLKLDTFFQLAHAIDVSYIGDLELFASLDKSGLSGWDVLSLPQLMELDMVKFSRIANAGLFEAISLQDQGSGLAYQVSRLGVTLIGLLNPTVTLPPYSI